MSRMRVGQIAVVTAVLMAAAVSQAQTPVDRVATDAIVIERVAEASDPDLPVRLLQRIVDEDIELLRGRRTDGSYQYANLERFEGSRVSDSFSVQPRKDRMETVQIRGANVYRVVIEVPTRRMLFRKNRPVWLERIDVEYIGDGSTQAKTDTFEVKAWMQPGENRPIDLPVIARQATVKVIATADPEGGYGNIDVALLQARIVDRADSPYAASVAGAKALQRALSDGDAAVVRATARRMGEGLGARAAGATVTVQQAATAGPDMGSNAELEVELQTIEDLLTGSESERRDGMDRLHQLIRRLR